MLQWPLHPVSQLGEGEPSWVLHMGVFHSLSPALEQPPLSICFEKITILILISLRTYLPDCGLIVQSCSCSQVVLGVPAGCDPSRRAPAPRARRPPALSRPCRPACSAPRVPSQASQPPTKPGKEIPVFYRPFETRE